MVWERVLPSRLRRSWIRNVGLPLAAVLALVSSGNARTAHPQPEIDREAFLTAIAEVETGGNSRAVGRLGERGQFQFRGSVWRQYTNRSFFEAHNPTMSYYVAVKHFDWLVDGFRRNGRHPTPYLMAAAWNSGLTRTLSGRLPSSTRSYAQRVSNIVSVLETPRVAAVDAPRRFAVMR